MRWAPPHLDTVAPYVPGKPIEALARELGVTDAIKLASNESPLGPAPAVVDAIRRAASGVHRYPDGYAYNLRERVASELGVAPTELVFGHGSNEVIDLLCRTVLTPADHAVIGVPSFVAYELCLRIANVPFTAVPLEEGLYWDLDAVQAAVQPETRLIFLDNPNNPTSTHVPGDRLRAFLEAVPQAVTVVIDEAYIDFVEAEDYVSAMDMRAVRERLVILRTFSKAHGLAALRVGYGVAPADLVAYLERVRAPFNVGALAQVAALTALDERAHLAKYVAMNQRERERLTVGLRELRLRVAPSQANFVTVDLGRPADAVYDALLRRGVIVRGLSLPLATSLRISVGTPDENTRLLRALGEAL